MKITYGKQQKALKAVLFGVEGVGKTSFGALLPEAVFIDTEGSTSGFDVARVGESTAVSWTDFLNRLNFIISEKPCQTLVIDSGDWMEKLLIKHLCAQKNWSGIEDPGYGKGYTYLAEEFGQVLDRLQALVDAGVNVLITAHMDVKKHEEPGQIGAWDRYELKLQKKDASLLKEWADVLLFANFYDSTMVKDKDGKKLVATGGKIRRIYTSRSATFDAKNRYDLPEDMEYVKGKIPAPIYALFQMGKAKEPAKPTPAASKKPEPAPELDPKINLFEPNTGDIVEVTDEVPAAEEADYSGLPDALIQKMKANNIGETAIMDAIKGLGDKFKNPLTADTRLKDLPAPFIQKRLIECWDKYYNYIIANGLDMPF